MNIISRLLRVRLLNEQVDDISYKLLHPLEPSVSGGYLNWEPKLSTEMLNTFRSINRLEFWDIGAAFGVFSLLAAHSRDDARVTSLEPYLPRNICCRLNTASNKKISVIKTFLGDKTGDGFHTFSSLAQFRGTPPTVIKMDIEGGEYDAIMSSLEWLKINKPIMFIEFHEGIMRRNNKSPEDLLSSIKSIGYSIEEVDHHDSSLIDNYVIKCSDGGYGAAIEIPTAT